MIDPETHVVDHIFEQNVGNGIAPDEDCIGIEWIPVISLNDYRFFPKGLIHYIIEIAHGKIPDGLPDLSTTQ